MDILKDLHATQLMFKKHVCPLFIGWLGGWSSVGDSGSWEGNNDCHLIWLTQTEFIADNFFDLIGITIF